MVYIVAGWVRRKRLFDARGTVRISPDAGPETTGQARRKIPTAGTFT